MTDLTLAPVTTPVSVSTPTGDRLLTRFGDLFTHHRAILVVGERGSGKDWLIKTFYRQTGNGTVPLRKVSSAAFTTARLTQELFGYESLGREAFRPSAFEHARGGVLYLDGLDAIPHEIQRRLALTLAERGDITLVLSSCFSVEHLHQQKGITDELIAAIAGGTVTVPPLCQRTEEMEEFVFSFLQRYSWEYGKHIERASEHVWRMLQKHRWPGNIRELKHAIKYSVAVTSNIEIQPQDLPPTVRSEAQATSHTENRRETAERELIIQTLTEQRWNKKKSAEVLGISRKTLYNKINRYRIIGPN